MKLVLRFCCLMVLLAGSTNVCWSKDTKKAKDSAQAAKIKGLIDEQSFTFNAQSASPSKGGLRQLSAGYDLRVKKDTVQSNLPYFGRSYQATYGTAAGGLQFTTIVYDYKVEPGKKEGWVISIEPKDVNHCQEMALIIYNNGSATLNVRANDKQPISYRGYITAANP